MNSEQCKRIRNEDGLVVRDNHLWIPPEETDLILRPCIVAHCGAQGHPGQHAMIAHLRRIFSIDHITDIVTEFVRKCLLCLHSKGGKIVSRPWSETIECSTRNGVLHFDYLYMGESYGESKYLLVLKDHATHYCELVVADTPDSIVVVEALLAWHSRFGIPPDWVSDNGTHFKNEVVTELSRRLRTQQTFTPAYSPWINGSIERSNRDILQVVRTMILTYKLQGLGILGAHDLSEPEPYARAIAGKSSTCGICPTPLREFYLPDKAGLQEVPANSQIDEYLDELRGSLQLMHCDVEDRRQKQRLLNKKRERGENLVNFTVGDFVLRSRVDEKHGNKLQVTWTGPFRVIRADAHSFMIQQLVTGDELDVHASRLKMYADSSLDVTDELLEHVSSQGIVLAVNKLNEHRWNDDIKDYEIRVSWKGLQQIEDSYEPFQSLAKEIRVLVGNYVAKAKDPKLTDYWQMLQGSVVETTSTQQPATSQLPVNQQPHASSDAVDLPQRRTAGRKRRRRQPARGAVSSAPSTSSTARVLPSASLRQPRRASDGDGQRRIDVEGHDPQPPLGSRTRSMTSAAPTSATGASQLEPASKRVRRQQRSRSVTPAVPILTTKSSGPASKS
ncbi:LOW QUALITY PROTEIN: Hypothetical protein PHPALM_18268 [Phytophthora palmivora]|uniref:Integrase catalytic domain-containing protein n=1 Tax=Phytophthora palmivora TaxID=4796 RepID=A0A2P4XK73_9STRA|nr:LOW QUALITY PROTEIN: Hypothetical protein PHPALM_18268 [Phytophthora palmivora]